MNKTKLLNEILNNVKEESKDLVKSEMNRVQKDFSKLTEDEKETVYCTDGTIGFVFDNMSEYEINNTPIQFDEDVFLDSLDEDTKIDLCNLVVEYCTEEDCE